MFIHVYCPHIFKKKKHICITSFSSIRSFRVSSPIVLDKLFIATTCPLKIPTEVSAPTFAAFMTAFASMVSVLFVRNDSCDIDFWMSICKNKNPPIHVHEMNSLSYSTFIYIAKLGYAGIYLIFVLKHRF